MRRPTAVALMGAALAVGLAMVVVIRLSAGPGERLTLALRATARWSFMWFWLASTAGALAALFGPKFQPLARRARDLGLAFAAAHLVHVGLVAWLLYDEKTPFPQPALAFFATGIFWTYLLALLSIRRFSAALSPGTWRIVRTVGVEYIALVFLVDFAKNPFAGGIVNLLAYLPFLALAAAGPLLRLAAAVKYLSRTSRIAA